MEYDTWLFQEEPEVAEEWEGSSPQQLEKEKRCQEWMAHLLRILYEGGDAQELEGCVEELAALHGLNIPATPIQVYKKEQTRSEYVQGLFNLGVNLSEGLKENKYE